MSSLGKNILQVLTVKNVKFKTKQNYLDSIVKCFPRLILGIAFCLTFPSLSQGSEICAEGLFLDTGDFIKISQDIYLSNNGKLYQEVACESYLTKEELKEYLEQYLLDRKTLLSLITWTNAPDSEAEIKTLEFKEYFQSIPALGQFKLPRETLSRLIDIEKILPNLKDISWNNIESAIDIISEEIIEDEKIDTLESTPALKAPLREPIEISPTYFNKFVDLERAPTASELLAIKRYLLGQIDSKLYKKYKPSNYILLENNNIRLRAKIKNLHREVTDSKWEILELTMTPVLGNLTQIDIEVSAILRTQSGLGRRPPAEKTFQYSEEEKALQEYVDRLIIYLKEEIPISDFKFDDE